MNGEQVDNAILEMKLESQRQSKLLVLLIDLVIATHDYVEVGTYKARIDYLRVDSR